MIKSYYLFERIIGDVLMLYSSKTGGIVILEDSQKTVFEKGILDDPSIRMLYEEGYLVDEDRSEIQEIRNWHSLYCNEGSLLNLTLMASEGCNFGCPYCFQYQLQDANMKNEIYTSCYNLVEKFLFKNEDEKAVRISWFGGEPTLDLRGIKRFMQQMIELRSRKNFILDSAMVTNGYLLTPQDFSELIDLELNNIQITLDGIARTHDTLRKLKNGEPTFDIIYNNLLGYKKISKPFRVAIRGNYMRSTLDSIEDLIDLLCDDFGDDERFTMYFRPVYDYETARGKNEELLNDIFTIEQGLAVQRNLSQKVFKKLGRELYSNMFQFLPSPMPSWCPSDRTNAYIVGADGSIYICDTMVSENHKVGRIYLNGEVEYSQNMEIWKYTGVFEKDTICSTCKLLPVCMGGCLRLRTENMPGCYWTEDDIYSGMEKLYAAVLSGNSITS